MLFKTRYKYLQGIGSINAMSVGETRIL